MAIEGKVSRVQRESVAHAEVKFLRPWSNDGLALSPQYSVVSYQELAPLFYRLLNYREPRIDGEADLLDPGDGALYLETVEGAV